MYVTILLNNNSYRAGKNENDHFEITLMARSASVLFSMAIATRWFQLTIPYELFKVYLKSLSYRVQRHNVLKYHKLLSHERNSK